MTLADIPAELKRDWLLPDGRARLQALPKPRWDGHALRSWVKEALQGRAAMPPAPPCGSSKSADTITSAFQIAAYSALIAIAIILALALRRALDVVLVHGAAAASPRC